MTRGRRARFELVGMAVLAAFALTTLRAAFSRGPEPGEESPRPPIASAAIVASAASSASSTEAPASAATPVPAASAAASAAAPSAAERADASLDRRGHSALGGGYIALTPDFASTDGVYDLVILFHGNTELVEQSLGYEHINAVFVPQNLGLGSGPYERRFSDPRAFPELLARVQAVMERRGLKGAHLGRIALIAWSAGYGAVRELLRDEATASQIDAVLLLDTLHIGFLPGERRPDLEQVALWERFARWAVERRKLFTITHSEITPADYLGVRESVDLVLSRLGVLRSAGGEEPTIPEVPAALGVLSKRLRVPLPPLTLAESGELHVRGYGGASPETHMLHILEMASTALPDLVTWWSRSRDASP